MSAKSLIVRVSILLSVVFVCLFSSVALASSVTEPVPAFDLNQVWANVKKEESLSRFYGHFRQSGLSLKLRVAAASKTTKAPTKRDVAPAPRKEGEKDCNEVCQELLARTWFETAQEFNKLGHRLIAIRYLRRLLDRFPATSVAPQAKGLLAKWVLLEKNKLDQSGRIEFIVFTGLYGIGLGVLAPLVAAGTRVSIEAYVFGITILSFTAAALVSSILVTAKTNMSEGTASLTWNATLWGAWNFFAIAIIAQADSDTSLRLPVIGSLLGYGVGLAIGVLAKPTAGVGFTAGSLGAWMLAYTGAVIGLLGVNNVQMQAREIAATLLVVSDVGFVAGAWLQPFLRLSRTRVLLLHLGAAVGAGAGVGIGLIAVSALQSSRESVNFMFIAALALSLGGGALTYWLTRGFAPEKQREEQISSGALLNMHKGRWAFGVPLPMFLPVVTEQTHKPGFQITVPLAGGRW